MSFEIKYDKHGVAIPLPMPEEMKAAAEAASVQVAFTPAPEPTGYEDLTPAQINGMDQGNLVEEPVTAEAAPEVAPEVVFAPKKPAKEDNFEELRQKAWRANKRAEELEAELALERQRKLEPEEDFNIEEDELVEGKHLAKLVKEVKKLKNQLQETEYHSSVNMTLSHVRQQYPDFDSVVSGENLDELSKIHPEVRKSIDANLDFHSRCLTAYKVIKSLGIAGTPDIYAADKAQAQKNAAKPKPLASISPQQGDSPLTRANAFAQGADLTPELKAKLVKEMYDARKAN
jgi:hypothetical protein